MSRINRMGIQNRLCLYFHFILQGAGIEIDGSICLGMAKAGSWISAAVEDHFSNECIS
jgi:hypothetical protein